MNPKKTELLVDVVEHIDVKKHNVVSLVEAMSKMAFSARDLGRAAEIYDAMLREKDCAIILCLAGSLISAGLKHVIVDLVRNNMAVCVTAVAFEAMLLACVTWEMRVQQRVIEDDGRKIIGEWLRANAAPGDRIFLEPLGYVGYYSHLKAYDYPGLTSREVVTAIREGATTYPELIAQLKPDWLILRPLEIEQQGITNMKTRAHYRVAKVINHGSDEPPGGIDAQAPSVGAGTGWFVTRSRWIRGARRSPIALRAHLPDRDAGRPEHWFDQLDVDLCPDQRIWIH